MMRNLFNVVLFLGFLLIQVSTDQKDNECLTPEGRTVCPADMLCSIGNLGNRMCHEYGEELPESHCLTESRVLAPRDLLSMTAHETCDVFHDTCPSGKTCCISKKGHHCYTSHVPQELRGDYFKD